MAYVSQYSNRLLKNVFEPEKVFGRIIYYNEETDTIETLELCKFKQFKAGTSYYLQDNGLGELKLSFFDIDLYNLIIEKSSQVPLVFQILTNDEEPNFGLFYFFQKIVFEHVVEENEFIREIYFLSFASLFEQNTIIEHTKEYVFADLPVDENGQKIIPNDYNTIIYKGLTFKTILGRLWEKNIGDNTSIPNNRVKGNVHSTDVRRKCKGIKRMVVLDDVNFPAPPNLITYSSEKKSFLEVKEGLSGVLKGQGVYAKPILDFRIDEATQLLEATYKFEDSIILENGEVKDNYTIYKKSIDLSSDITDVLIEESGENNIYYRDIIEPKPYQWKNFEGLGSGTLEGGEVASDLRDNLLEIAGANEIIDITELMIDFYDKKYFITVRAGQIIELIGYGEEIDGSYLIKQISAVFEDTYVSYGIDSMEKIN